MIKENKMQLEKEFYELIKKHYNIIKDEKRFKALLCDYFFPTGKVENQCISAFT